MKHCPVCGSRVTPAGDMHITRKGRNNDANRRHWAMPADLPGWRVMVLVSTWWFRRPLRTLRFEHAQRRIARLGPVALHGKRGWPYR